jgi:pullulanase
MFPTIRPALSIRLGVFACCAAVSATANAGPAAALASCDATASASVLHAAASAEAGAARGIWLSRRLLRWPGMPVEGRYRIYYSMAAGIVHGANTAVRGADGFAELTVEKASPGRDLAARFRYVGDGVTLALADADVQRLPHLLRGQMILVREDAEGRTLDATRLQAAAALDDLYAAAAAGSSSLGASTVRGRWQFRLWAPTAQRVSLCVYAGPTKTATERIEMQREADTGVWQGRSTRSAEGRYYRYLVDVFVPGVGVVRNRVTDPYSVSLGAYSARSYVADLDAAALKPRGWDRTPSPATVRHATDLVIYELHVRDFSIGDATVPAAHRGKYLAFAEKRSAGMNHLRALARAGMTDVHLLPVFDFATVPETGCSTPQPEGAPDGESQQALVEAGKADDCFNWGYDPLHFNAPEGTYASDAGDGARRIVEFRAMVQALHRAGLRVGMDVVYNHTSAAGQSARSVLDRIVPGYYHRLNADGEVETSTCCANTATEHRMMARLMIDSVVLWARHYRIDSFRFDLMGHQPRAVMTALQVEVDAVAGKPVQLIGEGWNFGEVADGERFVQASQRSLPGSGIATFSDRARDAVRGGRPGDADVDLVLRQGYVNGLAYDANAAVAAADHFIAGSLPQTADLVRVGLAGSLAGYRMRNHLDEDVTLADIPYGGDPAGYAAAPGEVVNYVENHDNQTLFDINAFKLPTTTSRDDRARVQILAAAITMFSQGIAYFHAGIDTLRSKSLDRNSYDSGDWFNRVDWTYRDNFFGSGLPPRQDNWASWPLMKPLLADAGIRPEPAQIAWTRDAFRDLLRIRASSRLFRLTSAEDVAARLRFPNTGAQQIATVLAGHLRGAGPDDAGFAELLYLVNVDRRAHDLVLPAERERSWTLHPVHVAADAADRRPVDESRYDRASGTFRVPARTALVYVVR